MSFDVGVLSLSIWLELWENFCDLNEVTSADGKKRVLLNYLSLPAYNVLRTSILPEKPKDKCLDDLLGLLQKNFEPTSIRFSAINKYESRCQLDGEDVGTFLQELRVLANDCDFGNALPERLLVRFVNGLKEMSIRKRLWNIADLTLDKAVSIALQEEVVLKELKSADVNNVEVGEVGLRVRHTHIGTHEVY